MPPATAPEQPVFRALDRPRPPSSAEQRLLSRLAVEVGPELTDQAASVVVVGECTCGCSSVQLSTAAAPLAAADVGRLSATNRSEHVAVRSTGRSRAGHVVSVELHVVDGRLRELQLFDTEAGPGVAVDPAGVTGLDRPEVG